MGCLYKIILIITFAHDNVFAYHNNKKFRNEIHALKFILGTSNKEKISFYCIPILYKLNKSNSIHLIPDINSHLRDLNTHMLVENIKEINNF